MFIKKCFFVCVTLMIFASNALCEEGKTAGNDAGRGFMGQVDSADKINKRIAQPMTSSSTPMKTFGAPDEQQTFNAQLTAPSSDSFLDIFVQPSATGDLQNAIVKQDLNFDGSFDYAFAVPVIISGVCANGIISCQQGTWNNCRFYNWKAQSNLKITLQERADIRGLAGCFCINQSCGSNLVWSNMDYVLTTLGGGPVAFIQEADPHVVVTSVNSSMTYIKYYGQKTSDMGAQFDSTSTYFSGTEHPEVYYGHDFSSDDERIRQASSPNSPYSQATTALNSRTNPTEEKSCIITRTIDFNGAGDPSVALSETCSLLNLDACAVSEEKICDYNNENCVNSYQNGSGTGLVPVSNAVSLTSNKNVVWYFDTNGNAITFNRTDGVIPASGALSSGSSLWWRVRRSYQCDTGQSLNVGGGSSRAKDVRESTDFQSGELIYTDGGVQQNVTLSLTEENGTCEKACKISRPVTNTQVDVAGGTWEYRKSVDSTETIYKTCVDNQCPVESGETIVINCACQNDFGSAAAMLETMQTAGMDITCSSDQ